MIQLAAPAEVAQIELNQNQIHMKDHVVVIDEEQSPIHFAWRPGSIASAIDETLQLISSLQSFTDARSLTVEKVEQRYVDSVMGDDSQQCGVQVGAEHVVMQVHHVLYIDLENGSCPQPVEIR